jgi:hypothetical protein
MAAAVKMPAIPNACSSIPVRIDSRGGSGVPAALTVVAPPDGGTNGDQLAVFTKKIPNPIKNSTTASLIAVTVRLNPELRRMPMIRITMRSSAMIAAGRFMTSPVMAGGRLTPKKLSRIRLKYCDHPTETVAAPTVNSRIRSHPMIQAKNSPIEA